MNQKNPSLRDGFHAGLLDAVVKMRIFQKGSDLSGYREIYEQKVDTLIQEWEAHLSLVQAEMGITNKEILP